MAVASVLAAGSADSLILGGHVLRVEERALPGPTPKGGGGNSRQGLTGQGSSKQQRPYTSGGGVGPNGNSNHNNSLGGGSRTVSWKGPRDANSNNSSSSNSNGVDGVSIDRLHTDVGQSLQLLGLGHRMGEVDTVLKAKDKEIERLHYEMMRMTRQQQQQQQTKGGGGGGINPHADLLSPTDHHGGDRTVDSAASSSSSSSSSSSLSSKSFLRMATEFLFREASHQDSQALAALMTEVRRERERGRESEREEGNHSDVVNHSPHTQRIS